MKRFLCKGKERIQKQWRSGISFLIAIACMALSAYGQKVAQQKITVVFQQQSLVGCLEKITAQTGNRFYYEGNELKQNTKKHTATYSNQPLSAILTALLAETGFDWQEVNQKIVIKKTAAHNQKKEAPVVTPAPKRDPGKITGKIIDEENGDPVEGATIRIGNKGTTSGMAGSFSISLPKGNYTAIVSYVGYGTKEVNEIEVKDNETFTLTITLKREKGQLANVVVKASAKKEGVAALYTAQKNRVSISDGISAEQIAHTPDNNMGQVLKRVSGVNTIDNRYVVVRGLTERYNQAMLDGIIIPSTDMNRRNFSFDIVPTELISNVVVNKTATPDNSAEFAGGQVTVNTLDIPVENFNSVTLGGGYNSRSTGKEVIQLGGRANSDYFGFDDGRRKFPNNIQSWQQGNDPIPDYALEQSRRFNSEQLKVVRSKAAPNQNYRVSLGRVYYAENDTKFGFVGGVTYRNVQETSNFLTLRNSGYIGNPTSNLLIDSTNIRGTGNQHRFATTLGGVLNLGVEGKRYKISLKNYYSRLFSEVSQPATRVDQDGDRRFVEYLDVPEITAVLQNKLDGEHSLNSKGLKLAWTGAITTINQDILDLRRLSYGKTASVGGKDYFESPTLSPWSTSDGDYDYRMSTHLKETDLNWGTSLVLPFTFLKDKSLLKIGYAGWHKQRSLGANKLRIVKPDQDTKVAGWYENILAPGRMGLTGDSAFYYADNSSNGDQYNGKAKYHSGYLMLDQRFKKFRLVYGIRAENFNMANAQEQFLRTPDNLFGSNSKVDPYITGEKNWRFLPSANLTYSLTSKMNLRAAYATTMVRPDFREASYFQLYDVFLDAYISGWNVVSTRIDNYDLRYEWYPSAGEIISVSGFYKKFDKPLELQAMNVTGGAGKTRYLRFQNQKDATSYGVEMEFRKNLGFIADKNWLTNIIFFGNGTITKSEVTAIDYSVITPDAGQSFLLVEKVVPGVKRPLYGQSPWIVNAGVEYLSKYAGATLSYNRSGYRSYVVATRPDFIEFENGRNMLDLQLSARVLKLRGEIKLNVSNLLDEAIIFYQNTDGYRVDVLSDGAWAFERKNGTDAYEKSKGDQQTYRIKNGRTASITFTYKF
ncbi:MAG: TonB-dependent receptor [Candidatus Pseudobacter hemicellulosilyticus]|uniref:TonB-dependent receptor n=1 Tax=Candidatus Pseudobacter hemicellulosilyticus TaxID=3121375 RepID=A0AAJ5WP02_9BACT|nr:MAG: TonB-dependent receptor [Pseudobacter sp.]